MLIPEASTSAVKVDAAFYRILAIEIVLLIIVTGAMVFFVLKYSRKKHAVPENVEGSPLLEIIWTIIPTLLVLLMFYIGWTGFDSIRTIPKEVMAVKVTARQWVWGFSYDNGKQSDVLRIPVKKPIKLLLTSQDVLHSFYIPAFRIKEDCVPNMETYLSFTADLPGTYDIFCTEYCGHGHSAMVSKVIAMEDKDFDAWYAVVAAAEKKLAKKPGEKVLEEKGCLGCHAIAGAVRHAPTFKGLYESQATVTTQGRERTIKVDEEYLRRSIRDPQSDIVKGYPPIMPAMPLAPAELDAIIAYLKELK